MKHLTHKAPERSRLGEVGHTVSERTAEAGHKLREEFDEVAPKVTTAASRAAHTVAHTTAERTRPIRAEAASRGSAALSGLLGEVSPAQIERISRHGTRGGGSRSRGRIALLLAAVGGVLVWVMWWKRSDPTLSPWPEDASALAPEPVAGAAEPKTP
ncbi:hypothetical protein ABIA35_006220 [Catenulispora sp. MAP12-49]|uniref:DUF5324 family protein n=1 Tax=unclassified Catenulispora TaxID=414885 RepID=UPI003513FE96